MNPEDRKALDVAREALSAARRKHDWCEDAWYSCPKADGGCANDSWGDECNCGADQTNAGIDAAIALIDERLQVKSKAEELAERGFVKPPHPTAADDLDERLQADEKFVPSLCKGVPDPRCNYLSACDQICNKCGRKHEPQLFSNWLQADEKEEPVAWRHNIERTEDGVRVCWGDHDRAMPCQWEHYAALRSREEG